MSDPFVRRLRKLDSCAVSDALDASKLSPSVVGLTNLSTGNRIAGRAITVKLGTRPPADGSKRHLCTEAIMLGGPDSVVVVEQKTGILAAGWGGVLSTGASLRNIAGVIVEGPARDIDEARDLGFSVYARHSIARTARGRIWETATNEPIEVGECQVVAGDYVLADGSGVAFIPASQINKILDMAERIALKEQLMVEALHGGNPITEIMGRNYEDMIEEIREEQL